MTTPENTPPTSRPGPGSGFGFGFGAAELARARRRERTPADLEFLTKTVRKVPEVAAHTGLTEAMLRDLIDQKKIVAKKVGRVWLVSTKSALDYLEQDEP